MYITITAAIFAIIAVLHLARIVYGWEAMIGSWEMPMWVSWLAVFIAGGLAVKGWKLRGR